MPSNSSRRSGGRSARHALRAAPLTEDVRPIRAGIEGGTYKPLSDLDVQKIHTAALDALEPIGALTVFGRDRVPLNLLYMVKPDFYLESVCTYLYPKCFSFRFQFKNLSSRYILW